MENTVTSHFNVDKEEYIRLVLQSLKDLDLSSSFNCLSQESGVELESDTVTQLRSSILQGNWSTAVHLIDKLNVDHYEALNSKIILNKQHYLESLECGDDKSAINILRHSLVPLIQSDPCQVQLLSSWLMCSSPAELRQRAHWDGSNMTSRSKLLDSLQSYIKPSIMLPQSRLFNLLNQAKLYQSRNNRYSSIHDENLNFSLLNDYHQDNSTFPNFNSLTVKAHFDEIWHCCFSHNGNYLATSSRDKSVVIWEVDVVRQIFRKSLTILNHDEDISAISWSNDDTILLTAAEETIYIHHTVTGNSINSYQGAHEHDETISSLLWVNDDSKFYSTGLDQKVIEWSHNGAVLHKWNDLPIRIMDAALTPDQTKLVVAGPDGPQPTVGQDGTLSYNEEMRHLMVYDTESRTCLWQVEMKNEISSLKVSSDSTKVIVNYAPDEIQIWSLTDQCLLKKLFGHKQSKHVIKSSFGGLDEGFVLSGSEDAAIYVWHLQSGELMEILKGHEKGCVNSVAWSPTMPLICSVGDDRTIRMWSTRTSSSKHTELNLLENEGDEGSMHGIEGGVEVDDEEVDEAIDEVDYHIADQ